MGVGRRAARGADQPFVPAPNRGGRERGDRRRLHRLRRAGGPVGRFSPRRSRQADQEATQRGQDGGKEKLHVMHRVKGLAGGGLPN